MSYCDGDEVWLTQFMGQSLPTPRSGVVSPLPAGSSMLFDYLLREGGKIYPVKAKWLIPAQITIFEERDYVDLEVVD